MNVYMKAMFKKAADILRAIAHPVRLHILDILLEGKETVTMLQKKVRKPQANISQHLAVLRSYEIIDYVQEGKERLYYLRKHREIRKIMSCIKRIKD